MSLLTISSNNPNLSYILQKNPLTIREKKEAFRREVRKGVVYGWFPQTDNQAFRLWFKDAEMRSSFADGFSEEFEYLDCSRYGSPYAPIAMITAALASASKKQHELDLDKSTLLVEYGTMVSTAIKVPNLRYLQQLAVHYADEVQIDYDLIHGRYYNVEVKAPTVFLALNVLQVLCILQCLCDPETFVRMDSSSVEKFIKVFNRANAPYYPRYLFQMKSINNRDMFSKLKGDLCSNGIDLKFGDTRQQRFDAVKPHLSGGQYLIDIGCGEMFQALRLNNKYELTFAIDADEERSENNAGKIKGRNLENIEAMHAFANPEWVAEHADTIFVGAHVLITEVLEHIEYEEAELLLSAVLSTDFGKVVVTCPNKDFNEHYALSDEEFRHPDHKWEPTFQQFCDQMVTLAAEADCVVACSGIGDCVNDSNTSVMAVFTKKEAA